MSRSEGIAQTMRGAGDRPGGMVHSVAVGGRFTNRGRSAPSPPWLAAGICAEFATRGSPGTTIYCRVRCGVIAIEAADYEPCQGNLGTADSEGHQVAAGSIADFS